LILQFLLENQLTEKRKWRNHSDETESDCGDFDQCSDILGKSDESEQICKLDKMKQVESKDASELETTEYIMLKDSSMNSDSTSPDSEVTQEGNYLEVSEDYKSDEDPDYEVIDCSSHQSLLPIHSI